MTKIESTVRASKSSVILIGMPGAGKSTVGVILAKALAKSFTDSDLLIQDRASSTLQDYLNTHGYLALRKLEEQVLLDAKFDNHVVSTGGSVVYSEKAMAKLREVGVCVYLEVSLETVCARVQDQQTRGIACAPGASLEDVFNERQPLYQKFADITVDANRSTPAEIVTKIQTLLGGIRRNN